MGEREKQLFEATTFGTKNHYQTHFAKINQSCFSKAEKLKKLLL